MGRLHWLVVVMTTACGNVAKVPDASTDAPFPDAFACTAPQAACGGQCIDISTSHDHCGACDLACTAAEDCVAGHCADTTASCIAVKQYTPQTPSGLITHKLDGTQFYCDVASGTQIDDVAFGEYDVAPPSGYTMIGLADFQNPAFQAAFIALFNKQGGAKLLAQWTATNCCFKFDASTNELAFGTNFLEPMTVAGTTQCDIAVDALEAFVLINMATQGVTAKAMPPLPNDFFTTYPPASISQCTEGKNPAFFWRKH